MSKKCKNDPNSFYIGTEPSPKGFGWCAHSEKIDTVKIGTNEKLWIVKIYSNNIKKWIPLKGYFTWNNGSKPYFLHINKDSNECYIYIENKKSKSNDYILYKKIKIEKSIIGKSTFPNHKIYDGNSILLKLNSTKYIFIGHTIYQFEISDKFKKYYSLVGNSSVSYPILLGDKNIYFMLDKKYIPLENFPQNISYDDAYTYFYGYGKDKIKYEKFSKKMIGIKKI